jgi:hypothetical protein
MTLITPLTSEYLPMAFTSASITAKDKLGDSFGTTHYLSTGPARACKLSQNCTGKQTGLNTVFTAS